MGTKTKQRAKTVTTHKSVRTSVSLPPELHDTLARMAKGKKVSVAWVIRDAAEKYVGDQWPLFDRETT
jgi:predicted DNA-binding ribbon-helix-helix protein